MPGLDTGPMLLREAVPITGATTAATLHDTLAELGARLILRALAEAPPPVPQPAEGATYAPKLTREDGRIDWTQDAAALDAAGARAQSLARHFTMLDGAMLKVLAASRRARRRRAGHGAGRRAAGGLPAPARCG